MVCLKCENWPSVQLFKRLRHETALTPASALQHTHAYTHTHTPAITAVPSQGQMFAIKRSRCKINDPRLLDVADAAAAAAGADDDRPSTAAVRVRNPDDFMFSTAFTAPVVLQHRPTTHSHLMAGRTISK